MSMWRKTMKNWISIKLDFCAEIIEEKIHQINENTTADFIWTVYNSGKYLYKIKKPFLYEIKINNTAIAEVL